MLLCTDPLPVVVGSTGAEEKKKTGRGEARGFKATGLACLAHQSPGIKCEQSCSSSSPRLPFASCPSHSTTTKSWHKVFWPLVLSFLYREMTRRVANSKVNYVFAASLVKKFELVKCCCLPLHLTTSQQRLPCLYHR